MNLNQGGRAILCECFVVVLVVRAVLVVVAAVPVVGVAAKAQTFRVVGSRVANSMSSAMTPASVRWFSSVDLPALVYPE